MVTSTLSLIELMDTYTTTNYYQYYYYYYYYYYNYLMIFSSYGFFRDNETIIQMEQNMFQNPSRQEANQLLFTRVVEDFNSGLPRKNPASDQGRTRARGFRIIALTAPLNGGILSLNKRDLWIHMNSKSLDQLLCYRFFRLLLIIVTRFFSCYLELNIFLPGHFSTTL